MLVKSFGWVIIINTLTYETYTLSDLVGTRTTPKRKHELIELYKQTPPRASKEYV